MQTCDLNCDMGEGIGNDEAIMPYITSANIACGYHAGNEVTMQQTVLLAKKHGVAVGAHPSFLDRQNFGRTEVKTTPAEVYQLVSDQINNLKKIAAAHSILLHHVKPHGALYNMAAKDKLLAHAIAQAVWDNHPGLILYGLSGSFLISEAHILGLKTASEVFADRTYQDDGSLTPRSGPSALIEQEAQSINQVLHMITKGKVTAVSGKEVPIVADTICLHSDGKHAAAFAQKIHHTLQQYSIAIKTIESQIL